MDFDSKENRSTTAPHQSPKEIGSSALPRKEGEKTAPPKRGGGKLAPPTKGRVVKSAPHHRRRERAAPLPKVEKVGGKGRGGGGGRKQPPQRRKVEATKNHRNVAAQHVAAQHVAAQPVAAQPVAAQTCGGSNMWRLQHVAAPTCGGTNRGGSNMCWLHMWLHTVTCPTLVRSSGTCRHCNHKSNKLHES